MNVFKSRFGLFFIAVVCNVHAAVAQQTININSDVNYHNALQDPIYTPAMIRLQAETMQYRRFNGNAALASLTARNVGDTLLLDFFAGKQYPAVIKRVTVHADHSRTITAHGAEDDVNSCFIHVSDKGVSLHASFPLLDEHYAVARIDGEPFLSLSSIKEMNKSVIPSSGPLLPPAGDDEDRSASSPVTMADDIEEPVEISVMVVYTQKAATWAANDYRQTDMDAMISNIMAMNNDAMERSGTGITFNLVYSHQTDYTEVNDLPDLERLTDNGDGYMDEVHNLRDAYGADMVVFICDVTFTGGVAWLLNSVSGRPALAFALNTVRQAGFTYTVVHEQGHNMGCGHHWQQTMQPGPGLFNYSSGYRGITGGGERYCTIMTYEDGRYFADGQYHPRIPYFSSPDLTYSGEVIGDANLANNVLTLKRTKHVVSRYREVSYINLATLTVSEGTLNPPFSQAYDSYTVEVDNAVAGITLEATPTFAGATVTGAGEKVLEVGENTFPVTVSYGENERTYTVTVIRSPDITGLTASSGTFTQDFNPALQSYELQLPCGVNTLTIAPTPGVGTTVEYTWNGASVTMPLPVDKPGVGTLQITAKADDETDKVYTLNIVRPFESSIFRQYWDDVLAVNLNESTNGGYRFTAYRWLKNGQDLGVTSPYLYFSTPPLSADRFSAVLTTAGKMIPACDISLEVAAATPVESSLKVYPNPARTSITVENKQHRAADRIELVDFNGRTVRSYPVAGEQTTVSLHGVMPGFYILRTGGQTTTIVIE